MNDEVGAGILLTIIGIFMVLGTLWLAELATDIPLNKRQWECTATAVINGRGECITYERKKQ